MNGVINVYKEKGFTSFDVVAKLKGILKTKKIGHTGTLDPDAKGVLPICIGNATKLCDILTNKNKVYLAVMKLGITTDTLDMSGHIIKESKSKTTLLEINKAVSMFIGNISQIPPMYSAVKVNGKKLYELARAGIEIERKPRIVNIERIDIKNITFTEDNYADEITMEVYCSKGTYIRSLCDDIGKMLGCGACMKELTRLKSGDFCISSAVTLEKVEEYVNLGRIDDILIPIDKVLCNYKKAEVKKEAVTRLKNGNKLYNQDFKELPEISSNEAFRVYDEERKFYAVYEWSQAEELFRPVKMFL